MLSAFDILASLAVDSPFCLLSIEGVGAELVLLVRDPEEVDADAPLFVASLFVGTTSVAEAGAVTVEDDEAELTSVAVEVRARL